MYLLVVLLYFVILNALLLVTDYFSLKIVKNTIGKNIKEQFNKKLFCKVFWLSVLSYVIGIMLIALWGCHDLEPYVDGIVLFIASFFATIYVVVTAPNTEYSVYSCPEQIMYIFIFVLLTFIASLILNYNVIFKKLDLKKSKCLCASLIVSAMTAPYFYLVPFGNLFGCLL